MKYLLIALISLPIMVSAQKIEQSFSGVTNINLTTGSGDLEIRKSTNSQVTITLEHSYGEDYKPIIDQRDDRLVIKDGKHKGNSGSQKYTIQVPDDTKINFTTGSGNISASGLVTDLKGTTGSGDLLFNNMSGEVKLNSGSGDLDIENFEGEFSLNVGSGDADIENYKGDLSINCGSGDVEADGIEGQIRINAGSGSIELEKAIITAKSSMNAGSGSVDISLGAVPAADVAINAGSGDASLDMNGNAFNGTIIMETDKRHGKISADFDFDTTEEIEENNSTKIRKIAVMGSSDVTIRIATGSGEASASE